MSCATTRAASKSRRLCVLCALSLTWLFRFRVLHTCQSIPFMVMSHSTQLKKPQELMPVVDSLVPAQGFVGGGTRVVLLGNNFMDTPGLRVRFDKTDVQPMFVLVSAAPSVSDTRLSQVRGFTSSAVSVLLFILSGTTARAPSPATRRRTPPPDPSRCASATTPPSTARPPR
jgi:hypothetical protein